jgi:hypothetical protein
MSSGNPLIFYAPRHQSQSIDFYKAQNSCNPRISSPYYAPLNITRLPSLPVTIRNVTLANDTLALELVIDGHPSIYFLTDTPLDYIEYLAVCLWDELERRKPPTITLANGTEALLWSVRPISDVTGMTEDERLLFRERYERIYEWAELKDFTSPNFDDRGLRRPPKNGILKFLSSRSLRERRMLRMRVFFTDKGVFDLDDMDKHKIDDLPVRQDYIDTVRMLGLDVVDIVGSNSIVVFGPREAALKLNDLPYISKVSTSLCGCHTCCKIYECWGTDERIGFDLEELMKDRREVVIEIESCNWESLWKKIRFVSGLRQDEVFKCTDIFIATPDAVRQLASLNEVSWISTVYCHSGPDPDTSCWPS